MANDICIVRAAGTLKGVGLKIDCQLAEARIRVASGAQSERHVRVMTDDFTACDLPTRAGLSQSDIP